MSGCAVGQRRQIALRLMPAEFEWVENRAATKGISINEQIRLIVRWGIAHVDRIEAKDGATDAAMLAERSKP